MRPMLIHAVLLGLIATGIATPALAQVGPDAEFKLPLTDRAPGAPNARHYIAPDQPILTADGALHDCLTSVAADPVAGETTATAWAARATGPARADAQFCLGTALAGQQRWDEATAAFLAGRDAAAPDARAIRARLGAAAGNAALAGDTPAPALTALDQARSDAAGGGAPLIADIAIDRARALVALNRPADAAAALVEARQAAPNSATAWLLSATLARRQNRLAEAQTQIETAARFAPNDPQVALEAGVIAVLAGHDAAARADWQSVIAAAPTSDTAVTAKAYIAQLGPAPAH